MACHDEYELQFSDVFDQIVAYAAGNPINVVNSECAPAREHPALVVARPGAASGQR